MAEEYLTGTAVQANEAVKEQEVPAAASEPPERTEPEAGTIEEVPDDGSMSLIKHLEELRTRLIRSLLAVAVGSCVAYYFVDDIMYYLAKPVGKLYFMQPSEAFFTYLKVAVVAGFLLALPVVFYHVWRFFLPALTAKERAVLGIVVPTSVLLFFVGLAFSFFLVLPAGIRFFMGFGGENLEALFSIDKYFDFVITFILPFGFVFELPLIITILGKIGILTSEFLKKYQRLVIFLSFIIGAFITPTPDIFTQSMIALPMIALYELGYWIVKYILKK
ncbi:MAG: twin-arginine translocase subunit TatC [Selenomonadaceae bacterium]|nr:twin-arginine translocase subunit TatC [Selenomonadaceae bacterium]